MILSDKQLKVLSAANSIAAALNLPMYIVGGVIRDSLLKRPSFDYDLVAEGDGVAFAKELHKKVGGTLKIFQNFLTAKILEISPDLEELDIASAREEIYEIPGALPKVSPATLEQDLFRRDFTINTLAAPLSLFVEWAACADHSALRRIIINKFSGLSDLDQRIVRVLHPQSFLDDPTRIFRCCRYKARIEGCYDPETKNLMSAAVKKGALSTISKFRILNELRLILLEPNSFAAMEELFAMDVFSILGLVCDQQKARLSVKTLFGNQKTAHKLQNLEADLRLSVFIEVLTCELSEDQKSKLYKDWALGRKKMNHGREVLLQIVSSV